MRKYEKCWPVLSLLVVALLLFTACSPTPADETPFRAELFHLEATLPPGWAAAEGPTYLANPFTGWVAFNSWGESGFWAKEVVTETSEGRQASYSSQDILGQLPRGGAYVVLIHLDGGPRTPSEEYGPEYERRDLRGVWEPVDCRQAGVVHGDFFKWGRRLRLEVYCNPTASDATVAQVNALLASWRFDEVPAGDIGWATLEARKQLPISVQPEKFPILGYGPTQSASQMQDVVRTTQAEVQGTTVLVTFTYRWNASSTGTLSSACPADCCHWWRIEARPTGEVVLVEESGAALPDDTSSATPATSTPTESPHP